MGLFWTAVFGAWTRYDSVANAVYLESVKRSPGIERILRNKETAISNAAYRTMMTYFGSDSAMLTAKIMAWNKW